MTLAVYGFLSVSHRRGELQNQLECSSVVEASFSGKLIHVIGITSHEVRKEINKGLQRTR